MSHARAVLPGNRLHLQHGPIDLVIGADGHAAARDAGFAAAEAAFDGVLQGLVDELDLLRRAFPNRQGQHANGPVAQRMTRAVAGHGGFVTPMAAVAGAVADHVLTAICAVPGLRRAYVNNGGDIALHLGPGTAYRLALAGLNGAENGRLHIKANDPVRGIATSGQGGRSLSMGIADSVTVLAADAARADVAATLIANAVDLPGHAGVRRVAASHLRPDSDLGDRAVVAGVGALSEHDIETALERGARVARKMAGKGQIIAAALFLRGDMRIVGASELLSVKESEHA